jgi:hypothetical protein
MCIVDVICSGVKIRSRRYSSYVFPETRSMRKPRIRYAVLLYLNFEPGAKSSGFVRAHSIAVFAESSRIRLA